MDNNLKRDLSSRQIQMIALGGTIGVGLFMGAASTIKWAGPSVILSYMIAGLIVFLVMRALGEMIYVYPDTGSYVKFAADYIHPFWGFMTASNSIFNWVIVGISEVVAVGSYFNYWWPELPTWIPGILVILIVFAANIVSVKWFGEFEFWFSITKVITILLMIVAGAGILIFGIWHPNSDSGISNLWSHGGFFPNGLKGFLFSLSIVFGSFIGVELIGITAGESKDPRKNIRKAINGVAWRIIIFYIGSIFIIVTVYPWDELSNMGSPFVATFAKVGITFAASIINFVVITAALSGCNSGVFSASRMMYTLSKQQQINKRFSKISTQGVPNYSIIFIVTGLIIGLILNIILKSIGEGAANIFVYIYSASILPGIFPWFTILISHLKFRKLEKDRISTFKMPFYPFANYVCLFALTFVVICMFINKETRISIIIGIIYFIIMSIYGWRKLTHNKALSKN